ncbi:hypothetical protein [Lysinibacillus xylanilyticus]|uniref:hypothetical protein n=1 Tax=Lysinibacillus xylanilyticus TaxID=582475 RepID=UPI002B24094F|nr:hypothetical protein [Lysinibacillus xylanilyticus]
MTFVKANAICLHWHYAFAQKIIIGQSGSSYAFKLCSARKAKRQRQMFYLRESEASATKRQAGTEINPTLGY